MLAIIKRGYVDSDSIPFFADGDFVNVIQAFAQSNPQSEFIDDDNKLAGSRPRAVSSSVGNFIYGGSEEREIFYEALGNHDVEPNFSIDNVRENDRSLDLFTLNLNGDGAGISEAALFEELIEAAGYVEEHGWHDGSSAITPEEFIDFAQLYPYYAVMMMSGSTEGPFHLLSEQMGAAYTPPAREDITRINDEYRTVINDIQAILDTGYMPDTRPANQGSIHDISSEIDSYYDVFNNIDKNAVTAAELGQMLDGLRVLHDYRATLPETVEQAAEIQADLTGNQTVVGHFSFIASNIVTTAFEYRPLYALEIDGTVYLAEHTFGSGDGTSSLISVDGDVLPDVYLQFDRESGEPALNTITQNVYSGEYTFTPYDEIEFTLLHTRTGDTLSEDDFKAIFDIPEGELYPEQDGVPAIDTMQSYLYGGTLFRPLSERPEIVTPPYVPDAATQQRIDDAVSEVMDFVDLDDMGLAGSQDASFGERSLPTDDGRKNLLDAMIYLADGTVSGASTSLENEAREAIAALQELGLSPEDISSALAVAYDVEIVGEASEVTGDQVSVEAVILQALEAQSQNQR